MSTKQDLLRHDVTRSFIEKTVEDSERTIGEDIAYFELSICGRFRVYPRLPSETVTLLTDALADTYGDWVEIIPAGIVPFRFQIHGIRIETIGDTGIYIIQVGDCAAAATPGTNDVQGEIRHRVPAPAARSTELIPFGCRAIAAYRRVMGRVMNDSGGGNCTVSVAIRRYVEVSQEVPKWPTFPW